MTEVAERLRDGFGLTLGYHHHLMMVVETAEEVWHFFEGTGDAVGILLDTGHAAAERSAEAGVRVAVAGERR